MRHRGSGYSLWYSLVLLLKERKRQKQQGANDKLEKAIRELGLAPVCKYCHSDAGMKLISWTDRETGKLKRAYKCQACDRWFYK